MIKFLETGQRQKCYEASEDEMSSTEKIKGANT
jgi:hypothetical protein